MSFVNVTSNASEVADHLENVSQRRLNAWVYYALNDEAWDFARHVRDQWLNGRAMNRRTGETADSVLPWSPVRRKSQMSLSQRVGSVYVRPGVGIQGSLNYLNRYVGTSREFMIPAFQRWQANGRITKAVDDNIDKMLKKVASEK